MRKSKSTHIITFPQIVTVYSESLIARVKFSLDLAV
uniref:Uncharacterized protein n=1 Tax=Cucumis melo TaxID=3656 RepID=A0A9I9CWV1_CUCME